MRLLTQRLLSPRHSPLLAESIVRAASPGFTPLPQPMLRAQVHSVGDVLHGRQFKEQTQIHQRQDQ